MNKVVNPMLMDNEILENFHFLYEVAMCSPDWGRVAFKHHATIPINLIHEFKK